MRVCFLTHNLRQDNGAGVFSRRLIDGLKKELGIEPVVFTSEEHPKLFGKIFKIRREIKKCDAVHALDGYPYGVIAYLASFGLGKKLIITAVGSGAIIYLYKSFYAFLLKRAYRAADEVIAVSRFTRDEILKKVPDLAIEVINHGVDWKKFQDQNSKVRNKEVSIVSLKPYILSVGSLRWRKGYHRSIEAFAKVAEIFPDLKYVIVGKKYDGAYYNRLKLEVSDLKLEGRVIILDKVDNDQDLIKFYKNAELFCLMAQTANRDLEGFGLVFLEAAAAGLPVVGTKGSGVEDAVLDTKNGILIDDPRNVDTFAEAIATALQNSNEKARMSKESLDLARRFGWESKIAEYISIYKNLKKPKIVYVTNARLPTEKAHGLATVKMAEAFADLGYQVELIAPNRWQRKIQGESNRKCSVAGGGVFQYYNLRRNFRIKKLPTIDLFGFLPEKLAFWFQLFSFSFISAIYCLFKYRTWQPGCQVVFFSHDHIPLYFLSWCGARIFYDIHHFPDHNMFYERVLKKSLRLSAQTKWKINQLIEEFGIPREKIVYWPNGTDVEKFRNIDMSKYEARKNLKLPQDKKIVVYTGQFFDWKGVDTLFEAASLLGDVDFYIVGGGANAKFTISNFPACNATHSVAGRQFSNKSQISNPNIRFVGQRPHSEIPLWLRAADVLILPNTGKQKVSLYYTSPMKMFEYMASGTPIVASRIPSITEILGDRNAFLAEADNPKDFAEQIRLALRNDQEAAVRARKALEDVVKYTWAERARKLSDRLVV